MSGNRLWLVLEEGRPLTLFMDADNAWNFVTALAQQRMEDTGCAAEGEMVDAAGRALRRCAWERLEAA